MVTGVTSRSWQSGLSVEAASESKSEVKGVDSVLSTQVSASGASKSTFMTSCWNAVIDAAVAIWRVISGIPRRIWDCVSAPFRREVDVSEGRDLIEVVNLLTELKHSKPGSKTKIKALHTQIRTAYNKLNPLVKQALQTKILSHVPENGIYGKHEDGTVDIIDATQYCNMPQLTKKLVQDFPSCQLSRIEESLSNGITEETRVGLFLDMLRIKPSDLDPQITYDFLNTRVFAVFNGFRDPLKGFIYGQIRSSFREIDDGNKGVISLDGIEVSISASDFPALAFSSNPRNSRVIKALSVVRDSLKGLG